MNKPNMKNRQRGRNNGKPRSMGSGGSSRNPNFDGGNMRPRGNAQQLMEKFLTMARDATAVGDRVAAENYFQHADHYYRVLNARFEGQQQNVQDGQRRDHGHRGADRQGDEAAEDVQGNDQDGDRVDQDPQPFNTPAYVGDSQPSAHITAQPLGHEAFQSSAAYVQDPQAAAPAESEIGLPPGILGMEDAAANQAPEPADEAKAEPRSPRRRRGRSTSDGGGTTS